MVLQHKYAVFLTFSGLLLLTGCTLPSTISDTLSPAALKITATPKSDVYIDNQFIGQTPINNKDLKAGTYTIAIKNTQGSWVSRIRLNSATVTIVNREVLAQTDNGSGEVVTLERGNGLAVIGTPLNAVVTVDGKNAGTIPLYIADVVDGTHKVIIESPTFEGKTFNIRATPGYKVIVNVDLARKNFDNLATPSQPVTTTPTIKTQPQGTSTAAQTGATVTVGATETGWLRVRTTPATSGDELFKINKGDVLTKLEEQNGWTKIRTTDGKEGWASSQYLVTQ